jgi:hypothetical protein
MAGRLIYLHNVRAAGGGDDDTTTTVGVAVVGIIPIATGVITVIEGCR